MNVVFQLDQRPKLTDAQRLSEALDRQQGVVSALVDPQLAKVFVTFDPDMTGDLTLQRVVEGMGYRVSSEGEPLDFDTETSGYLHAMGDEEIQESQATALLRDAEFTLPDAEGRGI